MAKLPLRCLLKSQLQCMCVCAQRVRIIDVSTATGTVHVRAACRLHTVHAIWEECLGSTAQHILRVSCPGEISFMEGCGTTR